MSIATDSAPVDKSGGRIRDMFRQVAPRYDLMNHLLSLNIDKWWRRCAVNSLNVQSQLPILDLCTGTGDLALAIDAKYGKQVRVVGSDFCGAMLEIARIRRNRDSHRRPHCSLLNFSKPTLSSCRFKTISFNV